MKKKDSSPDKLTTLLQESGLDKPSDRFAAHLATRVVHSYKRSYSVEYKKKEWLGKSILVILVLLNLFILYQLNPFHLQPVLFIAIAGFIAGFWFLIVFITKSRNANL